MAKKGQPKGQKKVLPVIQPRRDCDCGCGC